MEILVTCEKCEYEFEVEVDGEHIQVVCPNCGHFNDLVLEDI